MKAVHFGDYDSDSDGSLVFRLLARKFFIADPRCQILKVQQAANIAEVMLVNAWKFKNMTSAFSLNSSFES